MIEMFEKSREFRLNTLYTFAQGAYWMIVCCTISMGSAYLSNRGYSTFSIGVLFAFAYLFAAIVQQVLSTATDSSTKFNVLDVLIILGGLIILDLMIAITSCEKGFVISVTFLIGAMIATIIQPFLNALNFHIQRQGINMNYGVARASGSFFFFLMSLIAGFFMKTVSPKAAPMLGFIVSVLFVGLISWIYNELKEGGISTDREYDPLDEDKAEGVDYKSAREFVIKYKMFFVYLIGVVCVFFGHIIVNNFLYQIAVNVGGNEATNGGLLAVQAIVELPAMIFFSALREKFGSKLLLATSGVFYLVKIFFTAIASTIGMLYFSMLFQSLAFALFIPASVHFVDEIMSEKDAVKGQAFVTIAMSLSSLIGSVLGGIIINLLGVSATLYFATLVTFVGVIVAILGLVRINEQK
ncbi:MULTISPECIES: MFS transporter [Pseudobutyrivibrio]|uniref:MFS transporter, PPP family, 3-phenylpropionic acid transporter n=1 Tax=Pseudobutyrivibrio xylanivorans TaxID=185007 RepID=A0A1G5RTE1_PSEXY|nr:MULTISPECIES: MFS transporter [Pseudobutyrivibrio]MDC7279704.1 MFS transporter [Butyrivibrio fibrisolvens]SCZ77343.1 MFS transporter, PPP family, 3-phenylpropionic acid transporter [Pseudobutyrivibrio xylanivorans]